MTVLQTTCARNVALTSAQQINTSFNRSEKEQLAAPEGFAPLESNANRQSFSAKVLTSISNLKRTIIAIADRPASRAEKIALSVVVQAGAIALGVLAGMTMLTVSVTPVGWVVAGAAVITGLALLAIRSGVRDAAVQLFFAVGSFAVGFFSAFPIGMTACFLHGSFGLFQGPPISPLAVPITMIIGLSGTLLTGGIITMRQAIRNVVHPRMLLC